MLLLDVSNPVTWSQPLTVSLRCDRLTMLTMAVQCQQSFFFIKVILHKMGCWLWLHYNNSCIFSGQALTGQFTRKDRVENWNCSIFTHQCRPRLGEWLLKSALDMSWAPPYLQSEGKGGRRAEDPGIHVHLRWRDEVGGCDIGRWIFSVF